MLIHGITARSCALCSGCLSDAELSVGCSLEGCLHEVCLLELGKTRGRCHPPVHASYTAHVQVTGQPRVSGFPSTMSDTGSSGLLLCSPRLAGPRVSRKFPFLPPISHRTPGITDVCSRVWLYVGSRDPISGPHTCTAGSFPRGRLPGPPFFPGLGIFCVPDVCNKPPCLKPRSMLPHL